MHLDEVAFVVVTKGGARGAVGFVAHDEVKRGQAVFLLCCADGVDGVVGAEHHAHVRVVMALAHFLRQSCWVGRGWVAQLMHLHFKIIAPLLLAHVAVRAHGKAVQRGCAFLRPLGQGLGQ